MNLQPAREVARRAAGSSSPAPSTRRQPSASTTAARGSRRDRCARCPVRPSTFAVSNSNWPCSASRPHRVAVVEGRESPRQLVPGGAVRGVDHELAERLLQRALSGPSPRARRSESRTRRSAARRSRSGRSPARGAAAGEFARDREAREARPADQHVAVAIAACVAPAPPLGGSSRHARRMIAERPACATDMAILRQTNVHYHNANASRSIECEGR